MRRCDQGGYTVGAEFRSPDEPALRQADAIPVPIGCSALKCDTCGAPVQQRGPFLVDPEVPMSSWAGRPAAEWPARPDLTTNVLRTYACKCTVWLEGNATALARQNPDRKTPAWRCSGHPVAQLPFALDGITVDGTLPWRVPELLAGPPTLAIAERRSPVTWLLLVWVAVEETVLHDAIAEAVVSALEDPRSATRGRALAFLDQAPEADPNGRVLELAAGRREGFAGVAFADTGRTLEQALVQALASRALATRDPECLAVLRNDALAGQSAPTWFALASVDPAFVTANAEALARRGGASWLSVTAAAGTLDLNALLPELVAKGAIAASDAALHGVHVEAPSTPAATAPAPSDAALGEFVASLQDGRTRQALESFDLNALERIPADQRALVKGLLEARLVESDPRIAAALVALKDPTATPALTGALKTERARGNPRMVLALALALQALAGRDPTEDLTWVLGQRASFDVLVSAADNLARIAPQQARASLRPLLQPPSPAPVREGVLRPWLSTFWKLPVVDRTSPLAAIALLLTSPLDQVASLAATDLDQLEGDIAKSRLGFAPWTLPANVDEGTIPTDPRARLVLRGRVWTRLLQTPTLADVQLARDLDTNADAVLVAAAESPLLAFGPSEAAILRSPR